MHVLNCGSSCSGPYTIPLWLTVRRHSLPHQHIRPFASTCGCCVNPPPWIPPQEDEPLGRHPAGGFVSELPEPLNVARPSQRGVGAEDFAPPETLKVRWVNCT